MLPHLTDQYIEGAVYRVQKHQKQEVLASKAALHKEKAGGKKRNGGSHSSSFSSAASPWQTAASKSPAQLDQQYLSLANIEVKNHNSSGLFPRGRWLMPDWRSRGVGRRKPGKELIKWAITKLRGCWRSRLFVQSVIIGVLVWNAWPCPGPAFPD